MNHNAIYALYPQVVMIDDAAGAFDANGNKVEIDETAVAAESEQQQVKQILNNRIAELRKQLSDTDYVALADYDQDKPEIKAQRQAWRDEIRQLQGAA
jgi:hypothetical protein